MCYTVVEHHDGRPILNSSVIIDDHLSFPQTSKPVNTPISSTPYKQKKLLCSGKEFTWEGCLDDLRKFVQADLKLHGKWTSPGGEVKLHMKRVHIKMVWCK